MKHFLYSSFFYSFLTLISYTCVIVNSVTGEEIIEKIVAVVDDDVITLTELNRTFEEVSSPDKYISKEEVLQDMIDRMLLIKEAHKFLRGEKFNDNNELIKHYIDRRIRVFAHISLDDIEAVYNENKKRFINKKFYEVKQEIEKELIEKEVKKGIEEEKKRLRNTAIIKINPLDSLAPPLF